MRQLEHTPSRNFDDQGKKSMMREVTFSDFAAVAKKRGHTAESLTDRQTSHAPYRLFNHTYSQNKPAQ
jgi:hypothetical protein